MNRQGAQFLSARLGQWEPFCEGFSSWQAREAEFEAEQERIRREKEKEIARLRAMQEKAQDYQAEQVPTYSVSASLGLSHPLNYSFDSL